MMGKIGFSVLMCLALFLGGCTVSHWIGSGQFVDEKGIAIHRAEDIVIAVPNQRLPDYEMLTFNLKWVGIPVGSVTLTVNGIRNINGRDAYMLEARFKSNKFLSAIYNIDDRFVSYMDVEKLYSLRQEVYRNEGNYRKEAVTDFDQINHKAYFKNAVDKSTKVLDIPPGVQDTVSACYYFLMLPLKVGDRIDFYVYNSEQTYQLIGVVEEKLFMRTPALGIKEAFRMQPYVKQNGKQVEKGTLVAYFSCDKRRIPLMGKLKGVIFTEAVFTLGKIISSQAAVGER
ncbi:MAG TPA: DUF3108 domain-containing protein [Candidatus Omnitrophota bacterium]|nr:DUF3108 domain-containing protein [Candidatus Omnitrophota bacterium]